MNNYGSQSLNCGMTEVNNFDDNLFIGHYPKCKIAQDMESKNELLPEVNFK